MHRSTVQPDLPAGVKLITVRKVDLGWPACTHRCGEQHYHHHDIKSSIIVESSIQKNDLHFDVIDTAVATGAIGSGTASLALRGGVDA